MCETYASRIISLPEQPPVSILRQRLYIDAFDAPSLTYQ